MEGHYAKRTHERLVAQVAVLTKTVLIYAAWVREHIKRANAAELQLLKALRVVERAKMLREPMADYHDYEELDKALTEFYGEEEEANDR